MPGGKRAIPGASAKRERQYEHIKKSELDSGASVESAKRIAAATTNKARSAAGETKKSKRKSS